MINLVKQVLFEYRILLMKMALNATIIPLLQLIYLCSLMWKLYCDLMQ
jgi:hypothetical protein